MKDKLIKTAGRTWKTLGQKGELTPRQIAQQLKVPTDVANLAIGWLAREDKISFSTKKNTTKISLVENELNAFKALCQKATPTAKPRASKKKAR